MYNNRYSDEQIEKWERLSKDNRRILYVLGPVAVSLSLLAFDRSGLGLWFYAAGAAVIGWFIFVSPKKKLDSYRPLLAAWEAAVARSDPRLVLTVDFSLEPNEIVYYAERGQRYEERKTHQVINTQSRTKNAVGSAVVGGLLFGPAGAIVGGGMARRQTTGTSTDVYGVVPVDDGEIALTNQRFLFMGHRNTIEVSSSNIRRLTSIEGTDRLLVEYPGRVPGESYSVNPTLFSLSMARRAHHPAFKVPAPPAPLPLTKSVSDIPLTDVQEPPQITGADSSI